jgi:SAM-dependent methyltransferase
MDSYSGADILEVMEEAVNYNAYLEQLIQKNARGKKLLDFGAGSGQFAKPLAQKGFQIHCVEPDAQLRSRLEQNSLTVYDSLQKAPKDFETIYSLNVLEHVLNDTQMAQQIVQHLRPGGRILIYVPAFQTLYSPLDQKIGHHRRYTKQSLIELFPSLKKIDCRYVDGIGFFAGLYLRFLGTKDGSLSKRSVRFYDRIFFPLSRCLDHLTHAFFGKNVLYIGEKPANNLTEV